MVVVVLAGGCARLGLDHFAERPGSIKDDAVAGQPAARRPVPVRKARAPAARPDAPRSAAKSAAAAPPAVRAREPRTGAAGPAPEVIVAPQPPTAPPAPAGTGPVTVPAAPRTPPEAPDPTVTERQLEEGRKLFAEGKVIEARKRFIAAMNGPVPEALLALARSFDTHYLSLLPSSDGAPDMARAHDLYERAGERGAAEAVADLERIRATLAKPKQ
jgi:hypothetical protein